MTSAKELSQFVRNMLASPPRAGDCVNLYLFRLARVLHPYRSEGEILDTLCGVTANFGGRTVTEKEIQPAPKNFRSVAWTSGRCNPARIDLRWQTVNHEEREAVLAVADGFGLVDLWEGSPVRFEDNFPHTEEIVDALFSGDALLCYAKSNSEFATRAPEPWDWRHDEVDIRDRCFDFLEISNSRWSRPVPLSTRHEGWLFVEGRRIVGAAESYFDLFAEQNGPEEISLEPVWLWVWAYVGARAIHAFAGKPVRVGRPPTKRNAARPPA